MTDASERDDLEALLLSPGWLRFAEHVRATWGAEGYGRRLKAAISEARRNNEDVAEAVRHVDAANDEVNAMLSWPKDRVQALLRGEASRQTGFGRRGAL